MLCAQSLQGGSTLKTLHSCMYSGAQIAVISSAIITTLKVAIEHEMACYPCQRIHSEKVRKYMKTVFHAGCLLHLLSPQISLLDGKWCETNFPCSNLIYQYFKDDSNIFL